MARPVVLGIVSDVHAGSQLAPCPPTVRLDEGGNYTASKAQRWLWDNWKDYWKKVEAVRKKQGADLYVVSNGDATEGDHHKTTQILSGNLEAQTYVLHEAFAIPKSLTPDAIFIVRGTEAHVGPSAQSEEALGRSLKAEREPETHTWSWWHLRMAVHGTRLDFQHHGRVGTRPWTRASGIGALAFQVWAEHTENDLEPPHLAIRSHRHQYADSYDLYKTRAIGTPAWQLKTAHGHKVAAESITPVGGVILTIQSTGRYEVTPVLYQPSLPKAWVR